VSIKIVTELSNQDLADLVVTAAEGGINYWCQGINRLTPRMAEHGPWYGNAEFYASDFRILVEYDDPDLPEGNGQGLKVITNADFQRGIHTLGLLGDQRSGLCQAHVNIVNGDYDAADADVWFQCVVFDDVVYG
jgi:hypothetical protein